METTHDTIATPTSQPTTGKWWVLFHASIVALMACFGVWMDDHSSAELKIGAASSAVLFIGLIVLARLRLPSRHTWLWAIERTKSNPQLVRENSQPAVTFAIACLGAAAITTCVFAMWFRSSISPEHRPDGLLRMATSPAVAIAGHWLLTAAWMRPWDTKVKRMVDA